MPMPKPKTALVTGASRGIGNATARALAADGYRLLIHYGASRAEAESLAADIRAAGGEAEMLGADLSAPDAAQQLAAAVRPLCPDGLHALVLNAAIMASSSMTDCTPETFDRLVAINLRSPFFLLQALEPVLADGASVIFVSSVTARRAIGGVAVYAALKAAVETMVKRAAVELGPRWIRVNAVAPATTETDTVRPMTQSEAGRAATLAVQALKRIAQPEDIADVIAFLASDKARWIDGAVIPVDGGTLL